MFAPSQAGVAPINPLVQQYGSNPLVQQYSLDPTLQQSSLVPNAPQSGTPHSLHKSQYAPQQPFKRARTFISHRREHKLSISNHPTKFYASLPGHPKSWGFNPETGRDAFAYTEKGELEPRVTYSTRQIYEFIKCRPEQEGSEHLILWIQHPPAQFTHRYPRGLESGMCRWNRCPIKKNTIFKGHWRVALDERGDELGEKYDPFHNAGYLHLYCLEKMFNLIELFIDPGIDIRVDRRRMRHEEKNPMALNRDHTQLIDVVEEWETEQEAKHQASDPDSRPQRTGDDFLYWRLTAKHIELERSIRGLQKAGRGGVHLGRYMGDLHVYAALKGEGIRLRSGQAGGQSSSALDAELEGSEVGTADLGIAQQMAPPTGPITRKRVREEPDGPPVPVQNAPKKSKLSVTGGHGPSAADLDGSQRMILRPIPPPRKRGGQESDSGDPRLEQNSPKRPKFPGVSGQAETTAAEIDQLQRMLIRPGPVTRRQSQAMHVVLDKLSSGERNETRNMVQLIQALPLWKKRAVYNMAVKQAGMKRRHGSI